MTARLFLVLTLCAFASPRPGFAQEPSTRISIHGAAGALLNTVGDHQSIGFGVALTDRVELLINGERFHQPTERTPTSATRGGTSIFASGELRLVVATPGRLSPYVTLGAGLGRSKPNVNDTFPDPVTNDAWLMFAGGGVRVAVTPRFSLFGDVRAALQGERDTAGLLVPVRAGLAWRF